MGAIAAPPVPSRRSGPRLPARLLRLASDERLVAQVRGGSPAAFEAVYDRYHRGILSFCRHMLGSAEEAEDAVQHTFMAAYRDLVAEDKDVFLRAWLYAIARNRCLSVLRARREHPSDDIDQVSTVALNEEVERRQDLRDLLQDVSELPDDQRAALVLAEVGDLSHDEIGAVIGCRRDKVKALVFQARTSLAASRTARETPCGEVREQLAVLSGGALRRSHLKRHVDQCAGCSDWHATVRAQRRALAAVLPVLPSALLKDHALGAVFSGAAGGGAAAAAGSGAAGTGVMAAAGSGGGGVIGAGAAPGAALVAGHGTLAAKALVVVTLAGGGAATGNAVMDRVGTGSGPALEQAARAPEEAAAPAAATGPAAGQPTASVQEGSSPAPGGAPAGGPGRSPGTGAAATLPLVAGSQDAETPFAVTDHLGITEDPGTGPPIAGRPDDGLPHGAPAAPGAGRGGGGFDTGSAPGGSSGAAAHPDGRPRPIVPAVPSVPGRGPAGPAASGDRGARPGASRGPDRGLPAGGGVADRVEQRQDRVEDRADRKADRVQERSERADERAERKDDARGRADERKADRDERKEERERPGTFDDKGRTRSADEKGKEDRPKAERIKPRDESPVPLPLPLPLPEAEATATPSAVPTADPAPAATTTPDAGLELPNP